MKKSIKKIMRRSSFLCFLFLVSGCAASLLKHEESGKLDKMEEFDQKVKVTAEPVGPVTLTPEDAKEKAKTDSKKEKAAKGKKKSKKGKEEIRIPTEREPDLEDREGFTGISRRPDVMPFHVGEKVTLMLTYFGVSAGDMSLEVRPFVEVNGRKSYNLVATAKSSAVFSTFYAADDWVETYMDYETLLPSTFALHVKESKQLREIRNFFDFNTMKADYWEKRVTKDEGLKEKKEVWDILPFTQNAFSAAFYLRIFKLTVGKTVSFRVADENKNIVVKGEVLRKETLSTDAGTFQTLVMKPTIEIQGVFKPIGDVFFWITDDDHRQIVKIESKIRIGKIIGYLKTIDRGQP